MSDRITCKPTPWFLLRAAAMLLMFGVFSVMFFADGKWGYREKNLAYHVSKAFEGAIGDFKAKQGELGPEAWRVYAQRQTVDLPEDPALLPEDTPRPMPWPEILHDYERMKASLEQQPNPLFDEYRLAAGIRKEAPEKDSVRQIQKTTHCSVGGLLDLPDADLRGSRDAVANHPAQRGD
jgi:hypothetical protein